MLSTIMYRVNQNWTIFKKVYLRQYDALQYFLNRGSSSQINEKNRFEKASSSRLSMLQTISMEKASKILNTPKRLLFLGPSS